MRVRQLVTLASLAAIGASAWAGVTLWSARRAASIATQRVRADSLAGFSLRNLDGTRAPVEVLAAGDLTADGAAFDGNLYLAGNGGVSEYLADGSPGRRFRPGVELPPAPVTALAAGVLPNTSGRELLIGTSGEGLIVFDGSRLWQMRPHDAAARKVTALLPTASGRLLLGTESAGVLAYDGQHLQAFHPSLAHLHVTALAGDAADLWVGTRDQGVIHWHAGQVERWDHEMSPSNGLPDAQVLAIQVAGDLAFVGTPMGVAEFRAGRFDRVLAPGVFANTLLLRGRDLLIGTFDEGVFRVPLEARPVRPAALARGLTGGSVRRLFVSGADPWAAAGAVFALTDSGLHQLSGEGSWAPVIAPRVDPRAAPPAGQLTNANISALALDPGGRLWVGYFDRGLDIVDAGRVTHLEDDTLFCINRIATDAETRQVAVATANGLAMFDASGRLQQVLRQREGLLADHVTDVRFIRNATPVATPVATQVATQVATMVAATPAGLTFFDAGGTHSVSAFQGLVSNHVYAIGADGDSLLAGTLGGLSALSRGVVATSYTTANSRLKHNWITAIARVGQDWFVGTYGAGVMRLTPSGAWEQFDDLKTPVVINPNAMLTTAAHVYAGTLGNGLLIYDRDQGRWRTSSTGLPSMNVTALAASGGALYVGTDNGLVRIAEEAIQ
jgi:ligand-binding sensor domain-containing protein